MFNCPPDVALRQDWPTVRAIIDYRNATEALEAANDTKHGVKRLQQAPHLAALLLEMHRAQNADATLDGLYHDIATRAATEGEDG